MDPSHSTDQTESASSTDHLATVLIGGMELDVFHAAKQGNLEALRDHAEHLDLKLTATNNTVLHIYIECSPTSAQEEVESTGIVEDILQMCPALLLLHNKSGETALHIAARRGLAGIVGVLIDQAAKVRHPGDLEQGRVLTEEEACLQKQMLIRKTNNNKNTALHEAVRFCQPSVVEILTKEDPEFSYAANDLGETPLYLAVERGYLPLVSKMLSNCNVPTYIGPNGRTALHAAVIRKDEGMMEELIRADRTLSKAADELGCTPLHLAARFGPLSIVKQLLANDRSIAYIADKDGATALHFAASEGNLDVMRVLISYCPDCCELVDNKFQNALHYATRNGGYQIVGYVLADAWLSNILLNAMDIDGNTPLAHSPYSMLFTECVYDAKVDIMAFNKENLNVLDIILANEDKISLLQKDLKKPMQRRGIKPSLRIKNPKGNNDNKVEENQISKDIGKGLQKAKETHLVVATLIATVTFAAGFTMPGGYQSEKGPNQGSVFLSRNAAFKAFVITDTIAMAMSSCSVLVLLYSSIHTKANFKNQIFGTFHLAVSLTMWALVAMVVSFITGIYAVLGGHSPGLAVAACVLGCIFFFVFANSLLSAERKLLKAPHFLDDMVRDFWVLILCSLFAISVKVSEMVASSLIASILSPVVQLISVGLFCKRPQCN
ncbi:ankyrin repeat-containing protein [Pyrus ussuriensis x Pyrus communis]|uniref:Ankyrin repeat-containing protein n=1 Tax=Pyrus ussuriensis x Pyrus communis TaxID=2448454 RepID=A0A5N5GRM5_9ROSA|nr:ankyrin repeat-containing protein [Pyrus ussuriensis x Pyrus communis]